MNIIDLIIEQLATLILKKMASKIDNVLSKKNDTIGFLCLIGFLAISLIAKWVFKKIGG